MSVFQLVVLFGSISAVIVVSAILVIKALIQDAKDSKAAKAIEAELNAKGIKGFKHYVLDRKISVKQYAKFAAKGQIKVEWHWEAV